MKQFDFQIGAMPRSGSAWLATLLSMHKDVFCYHDALNAYDGRYREAASVVKYHIAGDSSSGCCLLEPLAPRTVYVIRDVDEVIESMNQNRFNYDRESFWPIQKTCSRWGEMADTVVKFEDLFSQDPFTAVETARIVVDTCLGQGFFEPEKWEMLRPLKVELFDLSPDIYNSKEILKRLK
jgi:hypothetical protein